MTIRKITFLIATLAAFQANADTFKKALLEAYQSNPGYAAALADFGAKSTSEFKALGSFMPTADLNWGYSNSNTDLLDGSGNTLQSDISKTEGSINYGANIRLNLFKGFSSIANLTQAQYSVMAAASELSANESNLFLSAINAYMDCLTKQKSLESYIASEQSLSNTYQAAKTRFQVGEFTKTDVLSAQASFESAKAKRIRGEGDLEVSRAQYQKVIGSAPGHLHFPNMVKEILPKTLEDAVQLTLAKNPTLIRAQFAERATSLGWVQAAANFMPTVDATFGLANSNTSPSGQINTNSTQTRAKTYGIGVTFRALDGFQSTAGAIETSERIQQAKMQLESARRAAIEAATKNWNDLLASRAEIQVQKSVIEATKIGLDGVRQGARLGANSLLQVLEMEDKHLQAQVGLADAQQKEVMAVYSLLSATGALSAKELGLLEEAKGLDTAELKPAVAVEKSAVAEVKKTVKKKKKAKAAKKADAPKVEAPVAAPAAAPVAAPIAAPADATPKA